MRGFDQHLAIPDCQLIQSSIPMDTPLRNLLEYLQDMGYGDLYLKRGGVSNGSERGREPDADQASAEPGAAPAEAEDSGARRSELERVAQEASSCTRCGLAQGRRTVVFGSGDPEAELMFIGEGPGAEEDRQGLPFVGPAGQLLTKIIQAIDLERDQVYICNVVKCRPPNNRDPLPDEVAACRSYLEAQIRLVRPKLIVALGRVAAQTLLGTDQSLGRMRGTWHQILDVPVRVTYHPAALLRNASYKRPTWDDLQVVRDRLNA